MRSLIKYIGEQFIIDELNYIDANIITESLNCKVLQDLAKQLKKQQNNEREKNQNQNYKSSWVNNKSFKEIFGAGNHIQWDKITDGDISVCQSDDDNKEADKMVRKVLQNKTPAFIIMQNPKTKEFEYAIFTFGQVINLKTREGYYSKYAGSTMDVRVSPRKWYDLPMKDKIKLSHGMTLYFIDIEGKYDEVHDVQMKRRESKDGMINFDERSLKEIAEQNVKRYKEIIAKRHAELDNDDELIETANKIVTLVADLSAKVAKDPITYTDLISPLSSLTRYIYDKRTYVPSSGRMQGHYTGVNGILPMLMQYINYKNSTAKTGNTYDNEHLSVSKSELKRAIDNANAIIQQYNLESV